MAMAIVFMKGMPTCNWNACHYAADHCHGTISFFLIQFKMAWQDSGQTAEEM